MLCYFDFVNETKDIVDLAKCYGATERRRDMTSYRDAETHLKRYRHIAVHVGYRFMANQISYSYPSGAFFGLQICIWYERNGRQVQDPTKNSES